MTLKPPFPTQAQGRRLATLSESSEVGLAFDDAIAKIELLDQRARRLEIDDSPRMKEAVAVDLVRAQKALQNLVTVGAEGDLLPLNDIAPARDHIIPEVN